MASAADPQSLAQCECDAASATFNYPVQHSNNIAASYNNDYDNNDSSPAALIMSSLQAASARDVAEGSDFMRFLELLNSDDQQLEYTIGTDTATEAFYICSSPESAPVHDYNYSTINDLAYFQSPAPAPSKNIMNPHCTAVCLHHQEYCVRENIPVHDNTNLLHGEQHGPTSEMTLAKSQSVLHHGKHKSHPQKHQMLFSNLNLHERQRSTCSSRHNPSSTSSKRSIGPYGRSHATEVRDTSQHFCGGDSNKLSKHKDQKLTLPSSKMPLASNTHVDDHHMADHTTMANVDQLRRNSSADDYNDRRGKRSSKHLDYERQRRKNINSRLYSLRAIVPNISKMDKASIVSDAIDYVQVLEKQIMNIDEEIQALELWGINVHNNFSRGLQHDMSSLICRQTEHKILRIDVIKVEEAVYQLEVIYANGQGVTENLTKALEALEIDIVYASLRALNDLIFNNIFIKVDKGVKLQPTELRDIILRVACIFGLGLAQDEVQVGSLVGID